MFRERGNPETADGSSKPRSPPPVIAALVVVLVAWFAVLFTGRYARGLFDLVEGVIRWHNRILEYAFLLATDRYPPFSLAR